MIVHAGNLLFLHNSLMVHYLLKTYSICKKIQFKNRLTFIPKKKKPNQNKKPYYITSTTCINA